MLVLDRAQYGNPMDSIVILRETSGDWYVGADGHPTDPAYGVGFLLVTAESLEKGTYPERGAVYCRGSLSRIGEPGDVIGIDGLTVTRAGNSASDAVKREVINALREAAKSLRDQSAAEREARDARPSEITLWDAY
jgi:hypothetical protein